MLLTQAYWRLTFLMACIVVIEENATFLLILALVFEENLWTGTYNAHKTLGKSFDTGI